MSFERPKPASGAELFAAALVELEAELDWGSLGRLYCSEGGEGFFPPEQVEAQRETGLLFAADLAAALEGVPVSASLYVGAAVAELIPALSEALVLGRRVVLMNLPGPEPRALNEALGRVEERLGASLPRILEGDLAALAPALDPPFGHLWMTSVLSDPEAFPALHLCLYGRGDRGRSGRLETERERARALVGEILGLAAPRARLTTTDEELGIVREICAARDLRLVVPRTARLSAIVGDAVRICALGT